MEFSLLVQILSKDSMSGSKGSSNVIMDKSSLISLLGGGLDFCSLYSTLGMVFEKCTPFNFLYLYLQRICHLTP